MEHLCVLSGVFYFSEGVLQDLLLIVFDRLLHFIYFLQGGYMNNHNTLLLVRLMSSTSKSILAFLLKNYIPKHILI